MANASQASAAPPSMQERFFAADRALQRGDIQETVALCQQLIAEREDYAPAYYLLAETYSKLNQIEKAQKFNDLAVRFQPKSFDVQFQRGKLMFVLSRWQDAYEAFSQARQLNPNNAVTVMLLGDVKAQLEDHAAAVRLFDEAMRIQELPDIYEHKGLSQLSGGDMEGARQSFTALLKRMPNHASAQVHLAKLDLVDGDAEKAEERLRKAIMIDPAHHEALAYLSEHLVHENKHQEAVEYGRRAIQSNPHRLDTVLMAVKSMLSTGHVNEAEAALRHLLSIHPDDLNVIIRLASILAPRGMADEALQLVEKAIARAPDNTMLQHTLSALKGENTKAAPEDYVARIFDSYSGNFDVHLQQVLGYHTPRLISEAIRPLLHAGKTDHSLLDLGCGTGLAAEALHDVTAFRVGVDLSPKMIEKAIGKAVYAETYIDEVVRYMQGDARHYDLVVAADVLVYIGDLEDLFAESARHLTPDGLFAISTEHAEGGQDYQIRASGRYAHTAAYVHNLAARYGLNIVHEALCDLRMEAGAMLKGMVYIMRCGA